MRGETLIIKQGAQGSLFAFQADEADARMRKQLQNGIQHSQPGAQDRHQDHFAFELGAARLCQRSSDRDSADAERARRLIDHQRSHFAEHAAEFLGAGSFVTQPGEVVLHQRMGDDRHSFPFSGSCRSGAGTDSPSPLPKGRGSARGVPFFHLQRAKVGERK